MKFQVFHVNPGEKLMKKDDNNELIRFLINFPTHGSGVKKTKKNFLAL